MPWGRAAMVASVERGRVSEDSSETRDDADDGRDEGQRAQGAVRAERLGVQHAEVLGSLVVLAHGVGHAGAGVHAGQGGADQRQEDGDRLSQHEVLAMPRPKQGIADDDHHVADGRGGPGRALHGVARVEEVICRKVLEEITDQSLDQQREDDRHGDVAFGVPRFTSHRCDRFEADQDQDGDRGLNHHPVEAVHGDDRLRVGVGLEELAG